MNLLGYRIMQEIQGAGAISFERFMAMALYEPDHGYYEKAMTQIGKSGDFYTSVAVGPLFGEMIALHCLGYCDRLCSSKKWHLVEAGAHQGQLAHDILSTLAKHTPEVFGNVSYHIIEPSKTRTVWQEKKLSGFRDKIVWHRDLQSMDRGLSGVFIANELLDAFPCRVFAWNQGSQTFEEQGVDTDGERFFWTCLEISQGGFAPDVPIEIAEILPDGYRIEVSPMALEWWKDLSGLWDAGVLMTFDYGFEGLERFIPGRTKGTLRAYSSHRSSDDVLQNPGEQDITAHVDFDAIRRTGEKEGLETVCIESQGRFFSRLLATEPTIQGLFKKPEPGRMRQWQSLTHPTHMGSAFRVLIQQKRRS